MSNVSPFLNNSFYAKRLPCSSVFCIFSLNVKSPQCPWCHEKPPPSSLHRAFSEPTLKAPSFARTASHSSWIPHACSWDISVVGIWSDQLCVLQSHFQVQLNDKFDYVTMELQINSHSFWYKLGQRLKWFCFINVDLMTRT